ncbi:hypothetical protein IscW_ISCW002686 [Ixodes scapularis]|uniref:Uncharacterized protein n=1 Tax=Ixodes scapularis TaxID=6945 RepID=B7PC55_IXOSC|nr:hypothetical protein IscW_ISCW002686 [Ixodes scapularis]|eukprot:XP_002409367.1 hypothetical protein IscW_ISCW002686 [Ixodes scapularis]
MWCCKIKYLVHRQLCFDMFSKLSGSPHTASSCCGVCFMLAPIVSSCHTLSKLGLWLSSRETLILILGEMNAREMARSSATTKNLSGPHLPSSSMTNTDMKGKDTRTPLKPYERLYQKIKSQ